MKNYMRILSLLLCFLLLATLLPAAGLSCAAAMPESDSEPRITEIRINPAPDKRTYLRYAEELDVTGGVVEVYGYYDPEDSPENLRPYEPMDDSEIQVLLYSVDMLPEWVSGFDNTVLGPQTLTVTYEGKTATFEVTIAETLPELELVGIQVSKLPVKLSYEIGETEMNLTGGQLTLRFSDDSRRTIPLTIEMINLEDFDTTREGQRRIGVTYGGMSTSFTITVHEPMEVVGIRISQLPSKLTYLEASEELDVSDGIIGVTYDGNDTEENLPMERSWVSGFDNTVLGSQTLTVEYRGEADTFQITVEHDYVTTVIEPTCIEGGYSHKVCRACGDTVDTDPTEALGHDYVEEVISPTCTEGGFSVFTCSRCGDSYADAETPPLGHDWGEPTYTWGENDASVKAVCVCSRSSSHRLEEVVEAELTVILEPTYMDTGAGIRTASFTTPEFETQTKEVVIDRRPLPCDGSELCPGSVFTDMPKKSNWAHDAIDWAYVNGITAGMTTTTFVPKGECIRAQVVTFLWRAAGCPEPMVTATNFTDLKTGAYYYKAVLWAVEKGITTGTSETTFGPQKSCTRGQFVTFLWRFMNCQEPTSTETDFTDLKTTAFYYTAVLWAAENGITTGTDANHFSPNATCTRAHVVTFLHRALAE